MTAQEVAGNGQEVAGATMTPSEVAKVAEGLSVRQRAALMTLPLPRDADPVRWIAARGFGDLWRKSSKHWDAMLDLERFGIVERQVSRGETLWRPTRGLGLAVRDYLRRTG